MNECDANGRGGELLHATKYWARARSVQDTDQTQQKTGKRNQSHNLCETKAKRTEHHKPRKRNHKYLYLLK